MKKRFALRSLFMLLLLATGSIGVAQYMQNFTTNDGLPSNEVYDLDQDDEGFMWFASDAGVSRFNGSEFQNFTIKDGLPDQVIFEIYKDNAGVVWVAGKNRKLSYFENERFHPYQYNDSILAHTRSNALIEDLFVRNGTVQIIFIQTPSAIEISPEGKVDLSWNSGSQYDGNSFNVFLLNEASYSCPSWGMNDTATVVNRYLNIFDSIGAEPTFIDQPRRYLQPGKWGVAGAVRLGDDLLYGSFESALSLYSPSTTSSQVLSMSADLKESGIFKMVAKGEDEFFAITLFDGIVHCSLSDKGVSEIKRLLPNERCNDIFIDDLGGTWIATYRRGVFHSNELGFTTRDLNGAGVNSFGVNTEENEIVIFTDEPNCLVGNEQGELLAPLQKEASRPDWFADSYDDSFVIYHSSLGMFLYNRRTGEKEAYTGFVRRRINVFEKIQGWDLFYSRVDNAFSLCNKEHEVHRIQYSGAVIYGIFDLDSSLYFGTSEGLLRGSDIRDPQTWKQVDGLEFDIRELAAFKGELLVGTKANGLFVLSDSLQHYTLLDGLPSNEITSVASWGGRVYVGTDAGIAVMETRGRYLAVVQVITRNSGLISTDITDLATCNDQLWVGSKFGVQTIPVDFEIQSRPKPRMRISKLTIGDTELGNPEGTVQLAYAEGPLRILYTGVDISEKQQFIYEYKWGEEGSPFSTNSSEILIPSLPRGVNELNIRVMNSKGVWSDRLSLRLEVDEPFWMSRAFLTLVAIGLLFIFIIFSWWREGQIREEMVLENRITDLGARALRAQMNPHFIFNSLNSIQKFILANDVKNSIDYLGKFAGLIRGVLDSSNSENVTLNEEIDNLKAYLDLEKMRFDKMFEYSIFMDEQVNGSIKIPAMLIQPYAENSVWHGLQNEKKEGEIKIRFEVHDNILHVSITDNGVGRSQTRQNKEKAKRSVGMTLTEERLKLVKAEGEGEVFVEDLFDDNGPCGTRVNLRIPFVKN